MNLPHAHNHSQQAWVCLRLPALGYSVLDSLHEFASSAQSLSTSMSVLKTSRVEVQRIGQPAWICRMRTITLNKHECALRLPALGYSVLDSLHAHNHSQEAWVCFAWVCFAWVCFKTSSVGVQRIEQSARFIMYAWSHSKKRVSSELSIEGTKQAWSSLMSSGYGRHGC
jgi:hypothetical protein